MQRPGHAAGYGHLYMAGYMCAWLLVVVLSGGTWLAIVAGGACAVLLCLRVFAECIAVVMCLVVVRLFVIGLIMVSRLMSLWSLTLRALALRVWLAVAAILDGLGLNGRVWLKTGNLHHGNFLFDQALDVF